MKLKFVVCCVGDGRKVQGHRFGAVATLSSFWKVIFSS